MRRSAAGGLMAQSHANVPAKAEVDDDTTGPVAQTRKLPGS